MANFSTTYNVTVNVTQGYIFQFHHDRTEVGSHINTTAKLSDI